MRPIFFAAALAPLAIAVQPLYFMLKSGKLPSALLTHVTRKTHPVAYWSVAVVYVAFLAGWLMLIGTAIWGR
ncbi:MAG: hypothetical protein JF595_04360 [Sphingomonadales bacterium]|nr:hypothetical protein [Sphingomonadales bacterium]